MIKFSRSTVEKALSCPLCCIYDHRHKCRPFSLPFTLNSAVDNLCKNEFDHYRAKAEPHPMFIEHGIDAVPFAHEKMDEWRENFKGVQYHHDKTNLIFTGAVDDLWLDTDTNEVVVVDYKATSKNSEVTIDADWQQGYRRQMDFYQWLLRKNGLDVSDVGYFVYCNGDKQKSSFENKS